VIGRDTRRTDSKAKLRGRPLFTADISYPGMLYGAVVRAPLAHGRIKAINRDPGFDWSRVTFATADDIPGQKTVQMIQADMPFLAWDEVLYKGEPVALVAAETREEAEAARRAVTVEMDPLPSLLTLDDLVARHQGNGQGRDDLVELSRWTIDHKGDVEEALEGADIVVEGEYTTPHQEQAYLETNAVTAVPEEGGRMLLEGSLQCPYYVAPAVANMLGADDDTFHVKALPLGGAFGGKEDFPSLLGGHAALLCKLSGKPVRMAFQRAEDLAYTTKRHPSWVRIRAGARRDGTLVAVDIDVVFDGGAYVTMSPVVLSRGAIHAPGAYNWDAVRINAVAYRTHTPPNGAFRGFGVPQTAFAIESHIDRMALMCGVSPHRFRFMNRLQSGHVTGTCQTLGESVGSEEALTVALEASGFEEKFRDHGWENLEDGDRTARGVGLAFYWHGAGFTGAGEAKISAHVALDLSASDRKAHIRMAATEMGQGSHTVLRQIVADELGIPDEQVVVDPVDTAEVPNSGPTVASRTTMIVGGELAVCARKAREHFLKAVGGLTSHDPAELALRGGAVFACGTLLSDFSNLLARALAAEDRERWTFESVHELAPHIKWDEEKHKGDAYACYAWGCTVAEVEVDLDTYEVRLPRVTVSADIGRAVNPKLATGQIEGGTLQSLGYALCEEVGVREDGGLLRDRFQTYILPTTLDAPDIKTCIVEVPYSRGPGGAKGLGEMPMSGGGPAVANALEHALGVRLRDLPLTPEKIFAAVRARDNRKEEEA